MADKKNKKSKESKGNNNSSVEGPTPTLKLVDEKEIAMDFATKAVQRFDKTIKSIALFGSQVKDNATASSDIDIIIIVDDASIKFDEEMTAWYREELGKIISSNPYSKELHINTIKLSTWWQDLIRGDPVVLNILRFGEPILDFGGFFTPLKIMMQEGKIRQTPEAIYAALQRAPAHLMRSRTAVPSSIEGLYWTMVDSAHAALMAAKQLPPSPEHVPIMLKEVFVDNKSLDMKYVVMYRDLYVLHRKIVHGEINDIKAQEIDDWRKKAEDFMKVMIEIVDKLVT
jgi:predicted nucleotidyltransferase